MHSEDPAHHEIITSKIASAIRNAKSEGEIKAIERTKDFEEQHYDVIKKFGRYPSRNDAMERKSTVEELDFLKNGPGWGAKQDEKEKS